MKICHVKEIVTTGNTQRRAFVNGCVRAAIGTVIDGNNRVGGVEVGIPTRYGAVFTCEDELGRLRVPIFRNLEKRRAVECDAGWIPSVFIPGACRDYHHYRNGRGVLVNGRAVL